MKLSPIIAALRAKCPTLARRVYGTAEFSSVEASTDIPMPCAYVIPLGESAEELYMGTDYKQMVEQTFGVVLCISVDGDPTGVDAFDRADALKFEIVRAIAGACVGESAEGVGDDTDEIIYDGMSVLDMSKARLAVQVEFVVRYTIVDAMTAHGVELAALPDFDGMDVTIDPMVPDGMNQAKVTINLKQQEG